MEEITALNALTGVSEFHARGINDVGWVVGFFRVSASSNVSHHAMISFGTGFSPLDGALTPPGQPAPVESEAYGVNGAGEIVGWRTTGFRTFAYMVQIVGSGTDGGVAGVGG
jgi:hypothetical protein